MDKHSASLRINQYYFRFGGSKWQKKNPRSAADRLYQTASGQAVRGPADCRHQMVDNVNRLWYDWFTK